MPQPTKKDFVPRKYRFIKFVITVDADDNPTGRLLVAVFTADGKTELGIEELTIDAQSDKQDIQRLRQIIKKILQAYEQETGYERLPNAAPQIPPPPE